MNTDVVPGDTVEKRRPKRRSFLVIGVTPVDQARWAIDATNVFQATLLETTTGKLFKAYGYRHDGAVGWFQNMKLYAL